MPLPSGTRLGPYEVLAPLGVGGMGEVYRARDQRLRREVALKVLPDDVGRDPARLQRFTREAQAVAALEHPNVLVVFDVSTEGVPFVAFELLSGATLQQRLGAPLGPKRAVDYARQAALGLGAAHARGIVHRDVTPANIFITTDGRVKLLDFGIASTEDADAESPLSTLTADGAVIGTAGYLAPEQARGAAVDARTDIFALGAVLFEMLTGRRAFAGATRSDAIAAVLRDEMPDVQAIAPDTPPALARIVRRCLEPLPAARFQSAVDLAFALETLDDIGTSVGNARTTRRWAPWVAAAAAAAIAAAVWATAGGARRWPPVGPAEDPGTTVSPRLVVNLPEPLPFAPNVYVPFTISPNGRTLAYTTSQPERLVLRDLDRFDATDIKGTDFVFDPFFSPDGTWIGFWTHGEIRKVPAAGGAPITIGPADDMLGAWWTAAHTIVYAPGRDGLYEIPESGGAARVLTRLDAALHETHHAFPQVIADGRAVLFTAAATSSRDTVFSVDVLDVTTGARRRLVADGQYGRYLPSGHLVFLRNHALMAVRFDPATLTLSGTPAVVLDGVATTEAGAAAWSASANGTLVYVAHRAPMPRSPVWVRRTGTIEPTGLPPRLYNVPRLSADGRTMVVSIEDGDDLDVWTATLGRSPLQRLTSSRRPGMMFSNLALTSDAREVAYAEGTPEGGRIVLRRLDNGTAPRELARSTRPFSPARILRDGTVIMNELALGSGANILALSANGATRRVLVGDRGNQWGATLSPDERYMAYVSDETGRYEIFVAPLDGSRPKQQVTTGGAAEVIWSRDGRELFYRNGGSVWAAPIATQPLSIGQPRVLFDDRFEANSVGLPDYDVAADGRFLMLRPVSPSPAPELRVILNWFQELRRLVP